MKKYIVFTLLISFIFTSCIATSRGSVTQEYYWRDFKGVIPSDAFRGGVDELGRPIYIGQVLFEEKLIPAKIYENDPNAYFDWIVYERQQTFNVKILCTPHPERFEWVRTKREDVVHLHGKILVKGGFQPGYTTYLGRVAYDGEIAVGKVICHTTDCLGLYLTKNGKGTHYMGEFDILTYNKDAQKEDSTYECIFGTAI